MGWVVNTTRRTLYRRERPGTQCIGGWVGLRVGLDRCGKSRPHRDSIPRPTSSQRVAIPSEISRPKLSDNVDLESGSWTVDIERVT